MTWQFDLPQVECVSDLIIAAPLRQYTGGEGAQVLAERAASEIRLANDEFLYHRGDTASSFYIESAAKSTNAAKIFRLQEVTF